MAERLKVKVSLRKEEAIGIVGIELRPLDGKELPIFTPGSHIDLLLPNGLTRQYSLLNDCRERDRYLIAVSKAVDSRGGSQYVHTSLSVDATLQISEPRNNFALQPECRSFVFVAGGIGITPILSMIRYCEAEQFEWRLLYLSRGREFAAFRHELEQYGSERVTFHFDDEAGCHFSFDSLDLVMEAGVPIYCCGPAPLMNAVADFSSRRPDNPAHFEWFAPPKEVVGNAPTRGFSVKLHCSGQVFHVPEDKTILEVLESNGYELSCSCRAGMCRTCETTVIDGIPDHRDYVLSRDERSAGRTMMICVSRANSPTLVLDI